MITDAREFQQELATYVSNYDYCVEESDGAYVLALKNHYKMPWSVRKRKRLFRGVAPSSDLYEPVATAVLDYLIDTQPVTTFFDLGAERGYFSFLAAGRCDKEIIAYAFEMRPHVLKRIQDRVEATNFRRVRTYLSGMSDRYEGERKIWYSVTKMFETEPESSQYKDDIFKRLKFRLKGRPERDRLNTALITIDSIDHFCAVNQVAPEVIKIDVDGYEQKVINGGLETFRKCRPFILLEIHRMKFLKRFAASRREVVKPLFDLGYRCIFLKNHHVLAKADPVLAGLDHPLWDRDRTDFVLFF
ncbi:FkbM family methyltransferase [Roseibium sp.]|uniref:FkbM family methyltransferase n=1 Tax=Roseibium sp. TaxID=1936156 RepID=UPI003A973C0F